MSRILFHDMVIAETLSTFCTACSRNRPLRINEVRHRQQHLLLQEDGEDALPLPVPHDLARPRQAVRLERGHPPEDGGHEVAEVLAVVGRERDDPRLDPPHLEEVRELRVEVVDLGPVLRVEPVDVRDAAEPAGSELRRERELPSGACGTSDIDNAVHRWLNPVAKVTITVN